MYNYWRSNRNVILTAVALFVVSLTALLYFLTDAPGGEHGELKANVVDSLTVKTQQEEEKNYRSLMEEYDHDGPLVVLGLDGFVEFTSWDFESVAGYRLDDIKEELFYSFIHPDDLSLFLGATGKVLATEEPVVMIGPYRLRDVNGEYRLQMASFYPIKKNEKIVSIIIAIRDITEDVIEESEPGQGYKSNEESFQTESDVTSQDNNNGHGNDADGYDESNPGKKTEKSIRNTNNNEKTRLLVKKLAWLFTEPSRVHLLSFRW